MLLFASHVKNAGMDDEDERSSQDIRSLFLSHSCSLQAPAEGQDRVKRENLSFKDFAERWVTKDCECF